MRAVAMPPDEVADRHFLVGFSGGLDSTVLLHAMARAHPGRVRAIHVHHGLHPDANAWARHCEAVCAAQGVPLQLAHVDVVDVDAGPEAAARAARHAAFSKALGADEALLLAHHRDDQAETFLLRALRGSGPDGLAAMRPLRRFDTGWLWRPLLALPRVALHAYAGACELDWIEDSSNADASLDRNYLRNRVMPLLRERWPAADAAFGKAAELQRQAVQLLATHDAGHGFDPRAYPLRLTSLRALPDAARARAFRAWCVAQGLPSPPARAVEWLGIELANAPGDRAAECRWEAVRLLRWRDELHIDDGIAALPADFVVDWDGQRPLVMPNGLRWTMESASGFFEPLQVRARRGGERIRLPGRTHRHDLKRALQAADVPPWQRDAWPLLVDADGSVLAAGDLHSGPLDAWLKQHDARLVLTRD